jgi:hypothetical protein
MRTPTYGSSRFPNGKVVKASAMSDSIEFNRLWSRLMLADAEKQ